MNAIDLMTRLGGEFLNNKIRAVIDGKIVILARMVDTDWVYTDEGQALANSHSNAAVEEAAEEVAIKPKRSKKAAEPVAEIEPSPEAPAAVELADVEPEL
jgi:hypothetical protein